jgi:uncharacterized protein (DUF1810 family)
MPDPHNLQRFLDAQAALYESVLAELRSGHKQSHWMWFVFPQIAGLGRSGTARFYAISSLGEAKAYLDHPTLGARLRQCTELVLAVERRSAHDIFGSPDHLKFRSSMTLFAEAAPRDALFQDVLEEFFDGEPDRLTLNILRAQA